MVEEDITLEWLRRDEGLRLLPYEDTAVPPRLTIGYGRNLTDNGISIREAESLLRGDYLVAKRDAKSFLGAGPFAELTPKQQAVIVCMSFNLGLPTLRKFKNFRAAVLLGDMAQAQTEMLNSRWATQVGNRSRRLAAALSE